VREFERWVAYLLSREGKSISAGAVASLRDNVGNSITMLAMELEKLVCLAGDRGVITEKHTEALLGRSRSEREYAVADAVASGDRTRALTALSDLLREGCNVSRIIGTLASQLERIWKAKEMLQEGRTDDDVCKELRIPTWRKGAFVGTASRSRRESLRKARASLVNAELRARSAKLDDRIIAELLIAELCKPPKGGRRTAP
jgi:DNA polymerase-3 subunit delta